MELYSLRGYRLLLTLAAVMLLVPVTLASAQGTLTPNSTLQNVSLMGNGNKQYSITLESGSWTVIVSSDAFWGMQFRVEVSLQSDMSNALVDVQGAGDQGVSAKFQIDSSGLVYIRVTEIGGQSGFFSIGVYDDLNAFIASMGIWLIVIPVVVIIVVVCIIARKKISNVSTQTLQERLQQVQIPDYAIPEEYRRKSTTADIRTVQVPEKCPSCGAPLSQDNLDWTGPLEAKCKYCGGVVRARFERI